MTAFPLAVHHTLSGAKPRRGRAVRRSACRSTRPGSGRRSDPGGVLPRVPRPGVLLARPAGRGRRCGVPRDRTRPAGLRRTTAPEGIGDYGLGQLCGDLADLLDSLELDRAVFVGHDWGGFVAWAMPALFPERCAGVVGVCTPYTPFPGTELPRGDVRRGSRGDVHAVVPGARRGGSGAGSATHAACSRSSSSVASTPHGWPSAAWSARPGRVQPVHGPRQHCRTWASGCCRPSSWITTPRPSSELASAAGSTGTETSTERPAVPRGRRGQLDIPALMICAEWDPALPPALAADMGDRCRDLEMHIVSKAGHWVQTGGPGRGQRPAGRLVDPTLRPETPHGVRSSAGLDDVRQQSRSSAVRAAQVNPSGRTRRRRIPSRRPFGVTEQRCDASVHRPTESPSTSSPVGPSTSASGTPPMSPATTGRPMACAWMNTMPNASTSSPPRRSRHGIANTSPAAKCAGELVVGDLPGDGDRGSARRADRASAAGPRGGDRRRPASAGHRALGGAARAALGSAGPDPFARPV